MGYKKRYSLRGFQPQEKNMVSHYQGFSLAEVLVALVLVTTTSLGLLTQQSHIALLRHKVIAQSLRMITLDNHSEYRFRTMTKEFCQ